MGLFHYLNVKNGDCSIIQHPSGNVTVIDVCNGSNDLTESRSVAQRKSVVETLASGGNFNQKDFPVNPIAYLLDRRITSVFRFILTHMEMDHMDGINDLFEFSAPANFWDVQNNCRKTMWGGSPYKKSDWDFYCSLRDGKSGTGVKRLTLYSNDRGPYYNQSGDGSSGGDGLYVLAPTRALVDEANRSGDYNDASYVILYRSNAGRILLTGDSHDKTWDHILAHHAADVHNVELLIAPHHGRKSGRSYRFLDVVRPRLTFFGNAPSEHLAYNAWYYRNLPFITNNQADCLVVDTNGIVMQVYCTNASYARQQNAQTFYSQEHMAHYLGHIPARARQAA